MFLLLLSAKMQAQFVFVPDSNFRDYIKQYIDSNAIVGNQLDTTNTNVLSLTKLTIKFQNINNLEGIQYFHNVDSLSIWSIPNAPIDSMIQFPPNLKYLNTLFTFTKVINNLPKGLISLSLYEDSLTFIGTLPTSLRTLNLQKCNLFTLPPLPDSLSVLSIVNNHLTQLNGLPSSLLNLNANINTILTIDSFPPGLISINLGNNQIDTLPSLPHGLNSLEVYGNNLSFLPALPPQLKILNCLANNLVALPALSDSLETLDCRTNPLTVIPSLSTVLKYLSCPTSVKCLPHLPDSLIRLDFYGCIPNRPPNLQPYFPLCTVQGIYFDVPDTGITTCNDSLKIASAFSFYNWNTGDTTDMLTNICRGAYSCTLTDSFGCISVMKIDVTDSILNLIVTSGPEQSCDDKQQMMADVNVTGGTPPYSYYWQSQDQITFLTDSCNTCNYLIGIDLQNYWYPDCGHVLCTVTDANGQSKSITKELCPNYFPDVFYYIEHYALCPGIPSGANCFWSAIMEPSGPDVNVWMVGLDSGTYTVTQPYGSGCTATWITHLGYSFSDCNKIYTVAVDTPDCGICNGKLTFINNIQNLVDISSYFDGFYSAYHDDYLDNPVNPDSLCPNAWYYFYFYVNDDLAGNTYKVIDSIFVPYTLNYGCPPVFPGDANNEGIADNRDVLFIGLAYNDTGIVRFDQSLTWTPKRAIDWTNFFADSTNHKHADCNGNGIVNAADTTAIILNYNLIPEPVYASTFVPGAPSLTIDLPDTLSPFNTYNIPISLGDNVNAADSIYGIAFSFIYNSQLIIPSSIQWQTDSGWLGINTVDLLALQYKYSSGMLDVSIVRTDHNNRNGYGKIGTLKFKTKTFSEDRIFAINVENITALSNNEVNQPVNTSTDSAVLIHGSCPMTITTNGTSGCTGICGASLQLQVNNTAAPFHFDWSLSQINGFQCIPDLTDFHSFSGLPSGNYICMVTDSIYCTDTVTMPLVSEVNNIYFTPVIHRESCSSCDGSFQLNPYGIHPPYSLSWDTSQTNIGNNSPTSQLLNAICLNDQTFKCQITDSLGCKKQYQYYFEDYNCLPDTWNNLYDSACTGQNNGYIAIQPNAGSFADCHFYRGSFTPVPQGALVDTSSFPHVFMYYLPPGDYIYHIISKSGCNTDSILVTVPEINVEIKTTNPNCGNCNGTAVAMILGDTINNSSIGWIFWSNDTTFLYPVINSSICENQPINYAIFSNLCPVINGTILLDSCKMVSSTPFNQYDGPLSFEIYPNPNNGTFTIQLPQGLNSKAKIEINNVLGELVYADVIPSAQNKKEIKLTKSGKGLFTCRIIINEKVMLQKFIIK